MAAGLGGGCRPGGPSALLLYSWVEAHISGGAACFGPLATGEREAWVEIFLEFLKGERKGAVDSFRDQDILRIGRNAEFEIEITDPGVSYEHAELRRRGESYWVVDRGSTNGTFLNNSRAHNSKLRPGDVMRFGKRGPELRFHMRAPKNVVVTEGGSRSGTGRRPRRRATQAEAEAVAEAARPPSDRSQRAESDSDRPISITAVPVSAPEGGRLSLVTGGSVLLTLLALVGLGLVGLQWKSSRGELGQAQGQLANLRSELRLAEEESARFNREHISRVEALRSEKAASKSREESLKEQNRLDRAAWNRERQRYLKDASRLEERVRELETQLRVYERAREKPGNNNPDRVQFQKIQKIYNRAVVLVFTQLFGKTKDGEKVNLSCTGTGFFIRSNGFLVTNKHVVQPWLFRDMAERLAREGIEVDKDSYQVSVWIAGSRFRDKGQRGFKMDTAFSTRAGSLSLVSLAPNRLVTVKLDGDDGPRQIKVHASSSNDDLAILKVETGGPFTALTPHRKAADLPIAKLDPVMVLGFPRGVSILETEIAETAPSLGEVYKVEDTIWVSAPIHQGNSGGPVFDRSGRVIGISTRVVKGTENLGSCIKIEHALKLLGGTW